MRPNLDKIQPHFSYLHILTLKKHSRQKNLANARLFLQNKLFCAWNAETFVEAFNTTTSINNTLFTSIEWVAVATNV